ncbi:hypothetical protein MPTK1_1g12400 [Marchantia polymorpha subsp. ruderalis]|uniref:Uncharacterized protein n=2 Tax=Marchantia polymorpha TaxID=3197 RepID=A0AAF6APD1_MARPO|nr:hypothetical protein MARPO_0019s0010 [Marchantia polymorpha]BBM98301.1 hypothetical protein Mp_1g12400 [Marchantia polymorpha subsp. ruderalis]|eukprot:PTQ44568.1 hypothetical protein MARPO_0019s0010 [Marchantia polymorpha]
MVRKSLYYTGDPLTLISGRSARLDSPPDGSRTSVGSISLSLALRERISQPAITGHLRSLASAADGTQKSFCPGNGAPKEPQRGPDSRVQSTHCYTAEGDRSIRRKKRRGARTQSQKESESSRAGQARPVHNRTECTRGGWW